MSEKKQSDVDRILDVCNLNVYHKVKADKFGIKYIRKQTLHDISFHINSGEIVGLVGESGCGKTTLAKSILSIIKDIDGTIKCKDDMPQMVFQDPYGSLNPSKTIGWILEEPLRIKGELSNAKRDEKVIDMLKCVGLSEEFLNRRPGELSGGQRQRVCLALCLMMEPRLIIADEPVSALDVTVQAQILDLLVKVNHEMNVAMLFISHDLKVVYSICDRVLVMKDGRIVEQGTDEEVYRNPKHPYTKQLLEAAGVLC